MSSEKISNRLKEARKSKGLQQKIMAEKLGISRAGYSRIETGSVEITTKNLVKMVEILDISLDWLILGKEVNQTQCLKLSEFGKYAGSVELMFSEMKENELTMHSLLSAFFELKGKEAQKNQKEQEKEQHV
jgi:transcriptional regulator with XRE-family HTH domain